MCTAFSHIRVAHTVYSPYGASHSENLEFKETDSEFTLCVSLILTIIYFYWLLQGTQLLKIQI